jgi:hypothetical protein
MSHTETQLEMFPDPDEVLELPVHRDDGSTSRIAARRAAPTAASQRGRLLELLHNSPNGLTAFEAWVWLRFEWPHIRPHGAGTRLLELRERDWALPTGRTRLTDTDSPAAVFMFNPQAEADYARWMATRR